MNTQTHILMGAALFGSSGEAAPAVAAALGGLAPDAPMIGMVLWAGLIARHPPRTIFGTLYFSPRWQALLAPWHSFWLWGGLAGVAIWQGSAVLTAFAASGLIHIGLDFFLHANDAHRQFWPLSRWKFHSPVSYWDSAHFGQIVRPLELLLALGLTAALILEFSSPWLRLALIGVAGLYAAQLFAFSRALR